jgi:ADP-ribose pyrophosphatase YjhB (NUDIX family)
LRRHIGHDLILIPSAATVTTDKTDRILLIHHAEHDRWSVPGGSLDPLESPADAAVRETWEETGILVELDRLLGVYGGPDFKVTYRNGDRLVYVATVFTATPVSDDDPRPDGEESLAAGWFAPSDVDRLELSWFTARVLADARAETGAGFDPATWRPPGRREKGSGSPEPFPPSHRSNGASLAGT